MEPKSDLPLKELTPSLEGFFANLTLNSLSPRGRLIQLFESGSITDIIDEVQNNAANLTAVELAAAIYTIRQDNTRPHASSAIAIAVVLLANRLVTNVNCNKACWQNLLELLSKKPSTKTLAAFLAKDTGYDENLVTNRFVRSTFVTLSQLFSLEKLNLVDVIHKKTIAKWINRPFLEGDECICSLVLTYSVITYSPGNDLTLEQISQKPACREFMLQAISLIDKPDRALHFLCTYKIHVGDDRWDFLSKLSLPCLEQLVRAIPKYSCTFIFALFSRLVCFSDDRIKQILEELLTKEWQSDGIYIWDEHTRHLYTYISAANKCVYSDLKRLMEACYKDEAYALQWNKAVTKISRAILHELQSFSETNYSRLEKLTYAKQQYRMQTGKLIKSTTIGLLFILYRGAVASPEKQLLFDELQNKLTVIKATTDLSEPMVQLITNCQLVYSSFGRNDTIEKDPDKSASQTPREARVNSE